MVSTRRSGSLPSNNSKRSSSPSDDNHNKPSSPKRQKGESHNNKPKASEPSQAENPKEISSGDPPEVVVTTAAPDVAASISVATPVVPEAAAAAVLEKKPRSSLASWKEYQGYESTSPWCRLLTVSPQNPTVSVYTTNFLVGSSQHANLVIKDQKISAILCSIRLAQRDDKPVAVLESRGSKGCVQVNGKTIKKNASCDLNSGDEVVFGFLGSHAYIFQPLPYDSIIKTPPPDVQTNIGKLIHVERRAGDASWGESSNELRFLPIYEETYKSLKSRGIRFPDRNNASLATLFTPPRSVAASELIANLAQQLHHEIPVQRFSAEQTKEAFDVARNSIELLNTVLSSSPPEEVLQDDLTTRF